MSRTSRHQPRHRSRVSRRASRSLDRLSAYANRAAREPESRARNSAIRSSRRAIVPSPSLAAVTAHPNRPPERRANSSACSAGTCHRSVKACSTSATGNGRRVMISHREVMVGRSASGESVVRMMIAWPGGSSSVLRSVFEVLSLINSKLVINAMRRTASTGLRASALIRSRIGSTFIFSALMRSPLSAGATRITSGWLPCETSLHGRHSPQGFSACSQSRA